MIILQDNKEKIPFDFRRFNTCEAIEIVHLDTADYTIKGLEHKIRIERKRTVAELANNLGKEWARFRRECIRLMSYPIRIVICEFSLDDILAFPKRSNIPKAKLHFIKMNGKFMLKRINELEETTGVKFLLCNGCLEAETQTYEILYNAYLESQS